MSNHLKNQTSPYLLQHCENPVDWYPWCEEAFERARKEDKPIFLSIGYSTCHWCHVMAHESFENQETANILNKSFVSIKVDREERPDIDSVYMTVCQAFTGSGGWPTSIFMTADKKPFFAGTYFPAVSMYGSIGFNELLSAINEKWKSDRSFLLSAADDVVRTLNSVNNGKTYENIGLTEEAVKLYKESFDNKNGGFGNAPKFPSPHNLIFLMTYYEKSKDAAVLNMMEKTLHQMYRGGIFDHIGYGFSRYSTDSFFLVPHFEKMLYDNALLISTYCKAYEITNSLFYRETAERTAVYILREMTDTAGGFYSAQDADSDGEEGKYYVFSYDEIIRLLGEKKGKDFNKYYNITKQGNFDGENIPNLLHTDCVDSEYENLVSAVYEYRKGRNKLHLDDKILLSWNSLMIAAMCSLYRVTQDEKYLRCATNAQTFIKKNLCKGDTLFVSYRNGALGEKGFAADYANYILALLGLYDATLEQNYLEEAKYFCNKAISEFYDKEHGGFYLYGKSHENLISRPKQNYDGAIPSENSVMTENLVRLFFLTDDERLHDVLNQQIDYMTQQAGAYPGGYAAFLTALSYYRHMPQKVVAVLRDKADIKDLPFKVPLNSIVRVLNSPTDEYPLENDKTTFFICRGNSCMPPVNTIE